MDVVARLGLNEKHPGDRERIALLRALGVDHASVRHYRMAEVGDHYTLITAATLAELKKGGLSPARFEQRAGFTTVRLSSGDEWWSGEARCSPEDIFIRRTGRIIALDRALERAIETFNDAAAIEWQKVYRDTPEWAGDRQSLSGPYSFPPIFSPRPPKAALEEKPEKGLKEVIEQYAAIAKSLSALKLKVEYHGPPPEGFTAEETEEVIKKAEEIIKVESLVPESELKETQEFLILRRFELFPVEKLTLDDLHVWTGYPLSTIEAILRELERQGFVTCTFEGDRGCWWLRNPGDYEPVIDLPTSAVEERDLRLEEEAARLRCQQAKLNLEAAVEEAGPKVQRKVAKALRKQGNLL